MKKIFQGLMVFSVLVALFALPSFVLADTAQVGNSPTSSDVYEIDNATPGTRKVQLGTRLRGKLQTGVTNILTTNVKNQQACGVGGVNAPFISPFTRAYVETQTAFGDSICLGDGYADEDLTFVLKTAKQTFIISPATKTGFSTVSLTASNATVTLTWCDNQGTAGSGWVVSGSTPSGVTIS